MIDIHQLYQSFISMRNTHQAGFYRPVRDFVPAVHSVSLDLFNRLCASLEKSEDVSDMLIPFWKSSNVIIKKMPTFEYAPYPGDYSYLSSVKILVSKGAVCASKDCETMADGRCLSPEEMEQYAIRLETEYEEHDVDMVGDSRFGSASRHLTRGPKLTSPIGTKIKEGVKVLPAGIGVVQVNYYRNPAKPVYNYTTVTQGVDVIQQYNRSGSKPLEWDEKMVPVFLYQLSKYYNLFIGDDLRKQVELLHKSLL